VNQAQAHLPEEPNRFIGRERELAELRRMLRQARPLLDTLADALRPRRMVLALDNCEHLIEACAEVGGRLLASSPGLRLLNTSRESWPSWASGRGLRSPHGSPTSGDGSDTTQLQFG